MESPLRIQAFEQHPSPSEFASQIESRNVPAVFVGCVKEWKAFSRWNPSNGGLDYLQELVGSSIVEAMLSRSAPVFYGDLKSHERIAIPFSTFIGFCKQNMQNAEDSPSACLGSGKHRPVASGTEHECLLSGDAPEQIYLAQVPIMNAETGEMVQLKNLREDIKLPPFLDSKSLVSINLWMNNAQARSSTHYDPHHNILCIVSGYKQVLLWPPSASPLLYPMPIYGEASNHSSVALENPDFSRYPRAEGSMDYAQKVILHAGDALFIPEGWFHQVDSDKLTIAVNFWWQSNTMSSMQEHMDAYYLRRILRRLTDKEMNEVLHNTYASRERLNRHSGELTTKGQAGHSSDSDHACDGMDLKRKEKLQTVTLHELEPCALQAVHELVSLVHDRVNVSDQKQSSCTGVKDSVAHAGDECIKIAKSNSYNLEDDPVAKILWNLEPPTFQNVILAVANNFPRTLEAFILHLLSPVGAEVLTRKFDEMDQQATEEDRNNFYQIFYGLFDDQFAAMDAILSGKESFGRQVFKNVLDKYLEVHCDVQKSMAG